MSRPPTPVQPHAAELRGTEPRGTEPHGTEPHGTGRDARRVLWVLLVVSLAGNAVASTVNTPLGIALGLVALACVAGLVAQRRRRPRR